jgi:hypothetical protein
LLSSQPNHAHATPQTCHASVNVNPWVSDTACHLNHQAERPPLGCWHISATSAPCHHHNLSKKYSSQRCITGRAPVRSPHSASAFTAPSRHLSASGTSCAHQPSGRRRCSCCWMQVS